MGFETIAVNPLSLTLPRKWGGDLNILSTIHLVKRKPPLPDPFP